MARYVKVVEVPPGPPVLAPIVAEIYGPDDAGQLDGRAEAVRAAFPATPDMVDVDAIVHRGRAAPARAQCDREKAALLGVAEAEVVATLRGGRCRRLDATYLQDGTAKYPLPLRLELPQTAPGASMQLLQARRARRQRRARAAVGIVVEVRAPPSSSRIYHKDLLPVVYVTGDMAGALDSPLYGMFGLRGSIGRIDAARRRQHRANTSFTSPAIPIAATR